MIDKIKKRIKESKRAFVFYQARLDDLEGVTGRGERDFIHCKTSTLSCNDPRILATQAELNASQNQIKDLNLMLELAEKLEK